MPFHTDKAYVLTATRRHAVLSANKQDVFDATVASRSIELVAGDRVDYSTERGEAFVTEASERVNLIARSYRDETKPIAANLDHLFIVAAVEPLFNTIFIDRLATVAHSQGIEWTLLVNKVDLGVESTARLIEVYTRCGYRVLLTSAKYGEGLEALVGALQEPQWNVVALAGISGVGKSTFLNQLVPGAEQRTNEVSEKTGQGRQTTSQAIGILYPRPAAEPLVVIDLPGIQHFGVAHLTKDIVAEAFPEIVTHRAACKFDNCGHINEQDCGVKRAVGEGNFAACRYQSYVHMLEEIERSREY